MGFHDRLDVADDLQANSQRNSRRHLGSSYKPAENTGVGSSQRSQTENRECHGERPVLITAS